MTISTGGPTVITSKAKEAVAFHATHFGVPVNDYGAGDECWYWTLTYGEHSELSFMVPQDGSADFAGVGLFYYVTLDSFADVDALHARLTGAGVAATTETGGPLAEPYLEDGMYQFWVTDPAGLRIMVHAVTP